jgi:hypothetical protein
MKPSGPMLFVVLTVLACGRTDLLVDPEAPGETDAQGEAPSKESANGPCAGADEELLRRWNLAVDSVGPLERDFHWVSVNQFPHPTWRLGDAIAYDAFADVLVAFWGEPSNVDFVSSCQLFDTSYASGPTVARHCFAQLRPLTRQLGTFRLVSVDRQQALERACTVIQAPAGPAEGLRCP